MRGKKTKINFKGKNYSSIVEACKMLGLSEKTVGERIKRGLPYSKVFSKNKILPRNRIKITYKGITYNSYNDAERKLGLPIGIIYKRKKRGLNNEDLFFKGRLKNKGTEVNLDGVRYVSIKHAIESLNLKINQRKVYYRLKHFKWTLKEALGLKEHKYKHRKSIRFRNVAYSSVEELAKRFNKDPELTRQRLNKNHRKSNYNIAEALSLKLKRGPGHLRKFKLDGKEFNSFTEICEQYKVDINAARYRLDTLKWTLKESLGLTKRKDYFPGKRGIVYLIINKINKKKYVGVTLGKLSVRWQWHIWNANRTKKPPKDSLGEALIRFGEKNFTKKILIRCEFLEEMRSYEKKYIKIYNSFKPNGYNLTKGGSGWGSLGKKILVNSKKFNSIADASNFYNLRNSLVIRRLYDGWSIDEAFNLKERKYFNPGSVKVKIDGMIFESIRSAAKNYNINEKKVRMRLSAGESFKEALTRKDKKDVKKPIKVNGKKYPSIIEAMRQNKSIASKIDYQAHKKNYNIVIK